MLHTLQGFHSEEDCIVMRLRHLLAATAALSMTAAPVAANANPAATLSVAQARTASTTDGDNGLTGAGGGGIIAGLIVAGIIGIVVIGETRDDDPDSP